MGIIMEISLFLAADAALPTSSKNKTGYQETLISFQRIYLWKGLDLLDTSAWHQ